VSSASQDYRDGAAYGAQEMARRLVKLSTLGVTITDTIVREIANGMQYEMGGSDQVQFAPERPWCDHCGGPFESDWLKIYGRHWDTCPNRVYQNQH